MQHPNTFALLSAIYAFTLAAAGGLPRGVGPEFVSFYEGKEEFSCITNAAIKLSLSQINDNTCDCPDGSDEPGTAACANIDPLSPEQPLPGSISGTTNATNALPGFWCANKGHIGMYVPFSYVNDGVCDYELCCDGSEEFQGVGGIKCENKCAEIGKEHRRLEEERRRNMEKATKKRKVMIKEAQELRSQVEHKITALREEIKTLEAKREELQAKRREVEQQEKGKVVKGDGEGTGGKLGVLVGLAKARVLELRNALENIVTQRDTLRSKVDELEAILKKFKEEYNPNFNDEGVKTAVRSFEEYAARQETEAEEEKQRNMLDEDIISVLNEDNEQNGVNWKEFEDAQEAQDTDILYNFEAYLPPFLRTIIHTQVENLRIWLIQNGMLADTHTPGAESHLLRAAREAVEAADRDIQNKQRSLESETADLSLDHGPQDIFRALKDKCVSLDAGEYTYEMCWLDKTMQKSKKGHGHSLMGAFKRIDRAMADEEERLDGKSLGKGERMVLRYEDGQQCWNGPKRRTDVWLACAETEEIWRVSESEKCVYKMEVGTPAACEVEELGQEPRSKDEL